MIRKLNKSIRGRAGQVLVVLFCIPFALFGAEAFLAVTFAGDNIGEVNGEPLTRYEYARLVDFFAEQRGGLGESEEQDEQIREQALDSLIEHELLLQATLGNGVRIPNSALDENIRDNEEFQRDGSYSPLVFAQLARQIGVTQDQLRQSVARYMKLYRLQSALNRVVKDPDRDESMVLWRQERDFGHLKLDAKDFVPEDLTDEDVQAFYEREADRFNTREEVDLSLVVLSPQEIEERADATVSDEDVQEAYDLYLQGEAAQPERRASHILLEWESDSERQEAMDLAAELHERLKAGEDFAELAQAYSEDLSKDEGGDLGYTRGEVFPEAFEAELAKLEEGAFSEPVEIEDSIHIIRLTEFKEAEVDSFEDAKERLRNELQTSAREELRTELQERMGELAFSSASIAEVAEALELEVIDQDLVYPGMEGETVAASAAVQSVAFAEDLLSGEFLSEPVETEAGDAVVVQVRAYRPARPQTFEEAKDAAREALGKELALEAMTEKVQLVDEAMDLSPDLKQAAESAGVSDQFKVLEEVERSGSELDRSLVDAAFALSLDNGNDWTQVVGDDDTVSWLQLQKVALPKVAEVDDTQKYFFDQQIDRMRSELISELMMERLRDDADIWLRVAEDPAVAQLE